MGFIAISVLLGAVLGAAAMWFSRRNAEMGLHAKLAELAASVSRLTHDLRGAMSPAMLMAERLEQHADPAVRQAAEVIGKALQRADETCRGASASAKSMAQDS